MVADIARGFSGLLLGSELNRKSYKVVARKFGKVYDV